MSELKVYRDPQEGPCWREFYEKSEADKVIAEKDKEIAKLKSDIADLRDDKKSTDAILDEHNAEIAELKDKLQAADKQIENLINSASNIMLFQYRVNDNKCEELRHQKYKRCLDKASLCFEKSYSTTLVKYDKMSDCLRNFYDWWGKRWLELAEKFKPNREVK